MNLTTGGLRTTPAREAVRGPGTLRRGALRSPPRLLPRPSLRGALLLILLGASLLQPLAAAPSPAQAGVALSFDDSSHLETWYAHRDLFDAHGARVTFFIDRPQRLDETQWEMLRALEDDGHEIGSHGLDHIDLLEYLARGGTSEQYVTEQVLPALALMRAHGLDPTAFAYPFGHRTAASDDALLRHFAILRSTERGDPGRALSPYVPRYGNRVVTGWSIDREPQPLDALVQGLDEWFLERAAARGEVALLYGHRLEGDAGPYAATDPDDLAQIFVRAAELGLRYYTLSELSELSPAGPGRVSERASLPLALPALAVTALVARRRAGTPGPPRGPPPRP